MPREAAFSEAFPHSLTRAWRPRGSQRFSKPLWTKSRHEISPRSTRRNEFSTRQPTGADRSISIVSRRILRFLIPSIFSHRFLGISFSFISCDDWKTIEDNCYEIDSGWIYMLSWFGDGRNTLS